MRGKLAPPTELPRRFYKTVSAGPAEGGHTVMLDGKGVRTPQGKALLVPTQALARMLAAEWDAQATHIDMTAMPATRLAFTVIDFVGAAREATAGQIARYAGADALCYFADGPQSLVQRQAEAWGPVLDWADQSLGLTFVRVVGIGHSDQPAQTLSRVARLALGLDDFALAALAHATALFESAVLALALERGRCDGRAAHDLARLDEAFQQERWGVDDEAALRTANMLAQALMLERWFAALKEP
jgi:chaperone required for assembly of F1-ATPase